MARYFLEVRTWRDSTYGNTYYSMRIISDGVDITVPMTYGHGDLTYKVRASEKLGIDWAAMTHEERRPLFEISETKVSRRSALHKTPAQQDRGALQFLTDRIVNGNG